MTRSTLIAALGAIFIAVALAAAPIASAHASRIATDPPDNAALITGPSQVSATFNERLQTTFSAMTVVGPDGNLWSSGAPRVQGAVISVDRVMIAVWPAAPTRDRPPRGRSRRRPATARWCPGWPLPLRAGARRICLRSR